MLDKKDSRARIQLLSHEGKSSLVLQDIYLCRIVYNDMRISDRNRLRLAVAIQPALLRFAASGVGILFI